MKTLTTLLSLGLASAVFASGFGNKKVLFIGIDGVRNEALMKAMATGVTPNLRSLADHGTITWNAISGGYLNTPTQQATMSGPGWASIYTGTWTDRHNVTSNNTSVYNDPNTASSYLVTQAPPFAKRLVDSMPTASVASISSWGWNEDYLVAAMPSVFSYHAKGAGIGYPGRDNNVKDKAVAYLAAENPDVLMLHFDQVDGAGHATGFSSGNPNYMTALANVDALIGEVLAAIQSRPTFASEQWLILSSTDHGGTGTSHGGQSAAERDIFLLVKGPSVVEGRVSTEALGQPAVAQTIFKYLGVPVEPAWQFAERPFGLAPTAIMKAAGTRAMIEIVQPAGGVVLGCTGIELWRDGSLVSTQPANVTSFTDAPPLPVTGSTAFSYEVRFAGTSVTPVPTALTLSASTSVDVITDRVLWLPFDGNSDDNSGRGNNATVTGSAGYATGRKGQALVINGSQFATLPATYTDLKFGAATNFTIAFWIQAPTQWTSDPILISNKNWNSGSNTGWAIAGQDQVANVKTWQWNFKGATLARMDFDDGGIIRDGTTWHHVAITHNRTGTAVMYADGVSIGNVSISGAGDVDTAFPIQIGRDGNGGNALNVTMAIDDLMIWRRELTAAEVAAIGRPQNAAWIDWHQLYFSPFQLDDSSISGPDADPDGDGLTNFLEFGLGTSPLTAQATTIEASFRGIAFEVPSGGVGDPFSGYQINGLLYQVEYSPNLQLDSWVNAPLLAPSKLEPGRDNRFKTNCQLASTESSAPSGFLRLKVTQQ